MLKFIPNSLWRPGRIVERSAWVDVAGKKYVLRQITGLQTLRVIEMIWPKFAGIDPTATWADYASKVNQSTMIEIIAYLLGLTVDNCKGISLLELSEFTRKFIEINDAFKIKANFQLVLSLVANAETRL
jgi:hypothetical protein